jgi:tripartite-type tricarboxylate transporter receptor subunit TctC
MLRAALLALLGTSLTTGAALAQSDYPNRPVKIIVPSTPGGGADTFGRLVAQRLSEATGQRFYVENRPGGGTLIGMEAAVQSGADGYTLYLAPSTITLLPLVKKNLPVSLANFSPVTLAAVLPQTLIVHPQVAAKDVKEFVALAKQQPGKLTYGSPGIGTGPQMAMQLFLNTAGIEMQHIPYRGVANVVTDLLAGRLTGMMLNMLSAKPHVEAGKLRALGVTSPERVAGMDNIPTIAEQGMPGYAALQWFGVFAPAGTPQPIVDRLQREIAKGLSQPQTKQRLAHQGAEPGGNTPAEFAAFLKQETEKWTAVAKAAKITPK